MWPAVQARFGLNQSGFHEAGKLLDFFIRKIIRELYTAYLGEFVYIQGNLNFLCWKSVELYGVLLILGEYGACDGSLANDK